MLLQELILEDYKTAKAAYVKQGVSAEEVDAVLSSFKILTIKNQFAGNEKNVDWWVKQGWEKFKAAVEAKKNAPTKTEVKTGKSDKARFATLPVIPDAAEVKGVTKIYLPLNFLGSRACAKNSKFCTAKMNTNDYDQIVLSQGSVLVYVIKEFEKGAEFYAVSAGPSYEIFWDNDNNEITQQQFQEATGVDYKWLFNKWVRRLAHNIYDARVHEFETRLPHLMTSDERERTIKDIGSVRNWLLNGI